MAFIAMITDQHFGVRGDSQIFLDYQRKFFEETFFPYLKEHNIVSVFELGDTFDRRKNVNYNTLHHVKEFYFDHLQASNIQLHSIVGNHDAFFGNRIDINSILALREYSNIKSYENPEDIEIDGCKFLMMPWINSENSKPCVDAINNTDAHIMIGHFELSNQILQRNFKFSGGINLEDVKKFEIVLSGHYHHKITKKNFKYLGTPYQMAWDDTDNEKGFHVFNTETREITFIKNPHDIYMKIFWEDKGDYDITEKLDFVNNHQDAFRDKYIKIIIKQGANPYILDRYIDALENCDPHSVVTEDPIIQYSQEEYIEPLDNIEDTLTILRKHINSIENYSNKNKLLNYIEDIYNEALQIEE